MRISDWSSDVCSSDLAGPHFIHRNFDGHTRFCGLSGVDGERSGGHAEQADIIAEDKMVDAKGHLCVHRIDGLGASLHEGRVLSAWQGRGGLRYDRAHGNSGGKDCWRGQIIKKGLYPSKKHWR